MLDEEGVSARLQDKVLHERLRRVVVSLQWKNGVIVIKLKNIDNININRVAQHSNQLKRLGIGKLSGTSIWHETLQAKPSQASRHAPYLVTRPRGAAPGGTYRELWTKTDPAASARTLGRIREEDPHQSDRSNQSEESSAKMARTQKKSILTNTTNYTVGAIETVYMWESLVKNQWS